VTRQPALRRLRIAGREAVRTRNLDLASSCMIGDSGADILDGNVLAAGRFECR
jgi:hypothetical protein